MEFPEILAKLNGPQREAVVYGDGPLLVLAGAGTGKTRVIAHRIAHLVATGVPPGRILAVTFTNKAAGEMQRRVDALVPGQGRQVWIHTFPAFACRLLRQHAFLIKLTPHFTIFDQDDQKKVVVEVLKEMGLEDQKSKAGLFVALISRAKDDLLDAGSYAIHTLTSGDPFRENVAKIYQRYQAKLAQAGALDFGDLLLKAVEILREHPSVAEYYQKYFLHLLVDEYQDTNHAQYVLTKTLSALHKNLCVVGDPDQSIYEWRGANIRNIMEFERDFAGAKVVKLEQNYRSTKTILSAADRVIQNNKTRKAKTLWTQRPDGEPVAVFEAGTEMEEARWIARRVQEFISQGASLSEIAVFYRTNAQSRSFEESFRAAQIPHRVVGAVRFYERKEIKDALAYARVLLNPADSVSLGRILNVPSRGIGKTSQEAVERFAALRGLTLWEALKRPEVQEKLSPGSRRGVGRFLSLLEELAAKKDSENAAHLMTEILKESGYLDSLEEEAETDAEGAARLDNLQELVNAMREYEEGAKADGRAATLEGYLEAVALQSDADAYDPDKPAVTLMTVHLAKGLEFPVVFLTGLEEGLFPIGAANSSPEDLEEERRLCYVGMTRAKDSLVLSYASTRRLFGEAYSNLPSRFIFEAGLEARIPPRRAPGGPEREGLPRRGTLRIGQRVRHPDFGEGSVLERSGAGEMMKVTVRFDDGRIKKLLLRYAPLEPL
jgi:DNA helicase-2/ATP-dependent DNA helicase PcrA